MGILDVLKVNTAGVAVAVGSTARYAPFPSCGQPATNAGLSNPVGVAVDSSGNIYVADNGNAPILRVNGTVSCLLQSKYFFSTGIVADDAGNVYFSVPQDHNVYEATASGQQVTLTGNQSAGCGGGAITDPEGLALDSTGNLFIADPGCNVIWQVNIASGSIAAVAGNANLGQGFSGDTGLAIDAQLSTPYGIAVDAASNLYIADTGNNRIREVVVGTGIINTIAGDGTSAVLQGPRGIAVAPGGTIYIADTGNQRIHPGAHPALGSYYQADATIGTSKPDRNLRMERGASWEHLQLQSQRSVGKHSLLEPSRLTRVRDGYQSSLRRKNDLRPVRDLRCKRPTAGPGPYTYKACKTIYMSASPTTLPQQGGSVSIVIGEVDFYPGSTLTLTEALYPSRCTPTCPSPTVLASWTAPSGLHPSLLLYQFTLNVPARPRGYPFARQFHITATVTSGGVVKDSSSAIVTEY